MQRRSSRTLRNTLWALLAVLLWFATGCGRDSGQVRIRGDVSFDGPPLASMQKGDAALFVICQGTQKGTQLISWLAGLAVAVCV